MSRHHCNVRRVDRLADILVATLIAALLAALLLHYFEPCAGTSMCMAAALTPTRRSWAGRVRDLPAELRILRDRLALHLRLRYYRWRLRSALFDAHVLQETLEILPRQLEFAQLQAEALALQVRDAELALREH